MDRFVLDISEKMAKYQGFTYNNDSLTTPSPINGAEVTAKWKRTWKGEVTMTILMPYDVIDTEVYVKTSRGHTGIQMEPWMSSTWRKTWRFTHPPNKKTQEQIKRFRQQKATRRISLHQTAGRSRQQKDKYWSPRPETIHQVHPYSGKSSLPNRGHQLAQDSQQQQQHLKRQRDELSEGSSTASAPVSTYYEQADLASGFHSIDLSTESPPEYEKELKSIAYVPKSPIYPPPDTYSDISDDNPLHIVTDEEEDSNHLTPGQKDLTDSGNEEPQEDSWTDQDICEDPSQDPKKQQTHHGQTLDRLSEIADTVYPVLD